MGVFEGSDIVAAAVRIEENGEVFYRFAAQLTKKPSLKDLFLSLAEDEKAHGRLFEKILSEMERNLPPEGYDGQYAAYLHDYVDNNLVFTAEALKVRLEDLKDEGQVLDFAIARELDSIHYYREMAELLPSDQRKPIERIIAEEKGHFVRLSGLKKEPGC